MNIILWLLQVALALFFLLAGTTKGFSPLAEMAVKIPWVPDVPVWVPRLAGISELLGALGLILPALTRFQPWLTPLAAAALALVMAMAAVFHLLRGEIIPMIFVLVVMLICGFVAWGRYRLVPISPR